MPLCSAVSKNLKRKGVQTLRLGRGLCADRGIWIGCVIRTMVWHKIIQWLKQEWSAKTPQAAILDATLFREPLPTYWVKHRYSFVLPGVHFSMMVQTKPDTVWVRRTAVSVFLGFASCFGCMWSKVVPTTLCKRTVFNWMKGQYPAVAERTFCAHLRR